MVVDVADVVGLEEVVDGGPVVVGLDERRRLAASKRWRSSDRCRRRDGDRRTGVVRSDVDLQVQVLVRLDD